MAGAAEYAKPTMTARAAAATVRWVMDRWRRNGTRSASSRRISPATGVDGEVNTQVLQGTGGLALWTIRGSEDGREYSPASG